ncbi:MAG: antibiotic biosynthesis monooxygenase [Oxalobacteraceae bacterium]|nr:MAG: antibiotic biosynthesis monooxygenase [Oxalobacteraceae bacterium]
MFRKATVLILEISRVRILPGKEADFERIFYEAADILSTVKGFRGVELEKSIDKPGLYYMMVNWETLENHLVDFPGSPEAALAMPLLLPLFDGMPEADHVVRIQRA